MSSAVIMKTGFDLFRSVAAASVQAVNVLFLSVPLTGRDGRGWTHSDGRRIRGRGRTPDHPFGEHSVWCHQRPGRWGRFQQLPGFGQQRPLEQQTSCCSGHQTWEHSAATIAVKPHILGYMRTDFINSPGLNQNLPWLSYHLRYACLNIFFFSPSLKNQDWQYCTAISTHQKLFARTRRMQL